MHHYDERRLIRELSELPAAARTAFALAAATRQISSIERFHLSPLPRKIVGDLWDALDGESPDPVLWLERLDIVMSLLPNEDEGSWLSRALAEDGLSSLAYAIRTLIGSDPQEAAWAARRAFEAADQAAMRWQLAADGMETNENSAGHTLVQRELARQRADLDELSLALIEAVRERALRDQLISETEATEVGRKS